MFSINLLWDNHFTITLIYQITCPTKTSAQFTHFFSSKKNNKFSQQWTGNLPFHEQDINFDNSFTIKMLQWHEHASLMLPFLMSHDITGNLFNLMSETKWINIYAFVSRARLSSKWWLCKFPFMCENLCCSDLFTLDSWFCKN